MSTAEGMEWNAHTVGARAVSRCACPLTTTVAAASAAHRGTTHYGVFWSRPTSENTLEWNEWLVCALHSYESSIYLLFIFS